MNHRVDAASRVAVLADIHGNAVALAAVIADANELRPDAIIFVGDLTWGPLPEATWALIDEWRSSKTAPIYFVRGNAERALLELRDTGTATATPRERWLRERHDHHLMTELQAMPSDATLAIEGLGLTRFCHGSPRSDEELITPATGEARFRALSADMTEAILVSAHTHIQFDRMVAGVRSVNAGSVGLPYEGRYGAYWAILGPAVQLRRTEYDIELAVKRFRASADPLAETTIDMLVNPPTPAEAIAHAEALEFSG